MEMPLFKNIKRCVAKRSRVKRKLTKVFFGVKLSDSFKSRNIPSQLKSLLVYIAQDGVTVTDLFRKPGNPQDMKRIMFDLESGYPINWKDYSFYTLANVAKRYLLHLKGGIFGKEAEDYLLALLDSPDDQSRIESMHSVIISQPRPVQQLLSLLFGIWFRMIYHTEVNAMSVEAVAKSVAGSVFPNSTTSPQMVERASKVMEYLITGFASANLFSREMIEYFTSETNTSISRIEKFKYEFKFPRNVPREQSVRLFMRLLLDESRKHNFHLLNDAVSKEVFESANLATLCPPSSWDCAVQNNLIYRPDESAMGFGFPTKRAMTLACTQPGQPCSVSENTRTSQKESITVTSDTQTNAKPSLPFSGSSLHAVPKGQLLQTVSPFNDSMEDPIQQLSEKHTCVTTTPLRQQTSILKRPMEPNPNRYECPAEFGQSDFTRSHLRSTYVSGLPQEDQIERPALSNTSKATCFNSVKRRQLERLQKRSDWFLSPPAGLRSSGLMHLDPSTPKPASYGREEPNKTLITTSSSKFEVRNFLRRSNFPANAHASASGVLASVNAPLFQTYPSDNIEDDADQDDEIRRLGIVDPVGLWDTNSSCGSKLSPISINTCSSSPNPSSHFITQADPISSEEKENYPEVETRYYVVQRYYGPEPRTRNMLRVAPVATAPFTNRSVSCFSKSGS